MILVVGGTGELGRRVTRRLLDAGESVRVLTRSAERGADLRAAGADVAIGDLRAPESLTPAMDGVDVVVAAAHGFAGRDAGGTTAVDRDGNAHLIQVAARAGVRRVVLLSAHGASPASPVALFREKHHAETSLTASDMEFAIVRPTAFMETWLTLIGDPLVVRGRTRIFGTGTNPINFVAVDDVAAAVVDAITGEPGTTVTVSGPENLSFVEFASTVAAASGTPDVRVDHVPRVGLRVVSTVLRPFKPVIAGQVATAFVMDTSDMTAPIAEDGTRLALYAVAASRYATAAGGRSSG